MQHQGVSLTLHQVPLLTLSPSDSELSFLKRSLNGFSCSSWPGGGRDRRGGLGRDRGGGGEGCHAPRPCVILLSSERSIHPLPSSSLSSNSLQSRSSNSTSTMIHLLTRKDSMSERGTHFPGMVGFVVAMAAPSSRMASSVAWLQYKPGHSKEIN